LVLVDKNKSADSSTPKKEEGTTKGVHVVSATAWHGERQAAHPTPNTASTGVGLGRGTYVNIFSTVFPFSPSPMAAAPTSPISLPETLAGVGVG
jgi:hypothetical protein